MKRIFALFILTFFTLNVFATFTAFPPQTSGTSTLNIGQTKFYGSIDYPFNASCTWSRSTLSMGPFPANVNCTPSNLKGSFTQVPSTNIPAIKFSEVEAGILRCSASGAAFRSNVLSDVAWWRFSDTSNTYFSNQVEQSADHGGTITGDIEFPSSQTNVTIELQANPNGASSAEIYNTTSDRNFSISCIHIPPQVSVFKTSCEGLDCINEFTFKVAGGTESSVCSSDPCTIYGDKFSVMSSMNRTGVGRYVGTTNANIFTVPFFVEISEDGDTHSCTGEALSTTSFSIACDRPAPTASDTRVTVTLKRKDSDYRVFDDRFVPVNKNRAETFSADVNTSSVITTVFENDISETGTVTTSGTFKFTASKDVVVWASMWVAASDVNGIFGYIRKNGNYEVGRAITKNGSWTNSIANPSAPFKLKAGEFFDVALGADTGFSNAKLTFVVRPVENHAYIANVDITNTNKTPNAVNPVLYSAFITDGAGTTTISREIGTFINGVCSNSVLGEYVCPFEDGAFSATPNCSATIEVASGNNRSITISAISNSSITLNGRDQQTSTAVDANFMLICHGVQ